MSDDLTITVPDEKGQGGQHTAVTSSEVTVALDNRISITCHLHRSRKKNKELAISLIELAVGVRYEP